MGYLPADAGSPNVSIMTQAHLLLVIFYSMRPYNIFDETYTATEYVLLPSLHFRSSTIPSDVSRTGPAPDHGCDPNPDNKTRRKLISLADVSTLAIDGTCPSRMLLRCH